MTPAEIATAYAAGATYRALKAATGYQTNRLASILADHGVQPRKRGGDYRHKRRLTGLPRAVRVQCRTRGRWCVTHDLPGECERCAL